MSRTIKRAYTFVLTHHSRPRIVAAHAPDSRVRYREVQPSAVTVSGILATTPAVQVNLSPNRLPRTIAVSVEVPAVTAPEEARQSWTPVTFPCPSSPRTWQV